MKLKFTRKKEDWPETEYFQKLRGKGLHPSFHMNCEILREEGGGNVSNEYQYMPAQLRDDISSEYQANQLIRAVENIMSGRTDKWSATGNAWTVVLGPGGAVFEYAIMDGAPGGRVSLGAYLHALEAWRSFLIDENCLERLVELSD